MLDIQAGEANGDGRSQGRAAQYFREEKHPIKETSGMGYGGKKPFGIWQIGAQALGINLHRVIFNMLFINGIPKLQLSLLKNWSNDIFLIGFY